MATKKSTLPTIEIISLEDLVGPVVNAPCYEAMVESDAVEMSEAEGGRDAYAMAGRSTSRALDYEREADAMLEETYADLP